MAIGSSTATSVTGWTVSATTDTTTSVTTYTLTSNTGVNYTVTGQGSIAYKDVLAQLSTQGYTAPLLPIGVYDAIQTAGQQSIDQANANAAAGAESSTATPVPPESDPTANTSQSEATTSPLPSTGTDAEPVPVDSAPTTPSASQGSSTTTNCGITMSYSNSTGDYTLTLPSGQNLQSSDPNDLQIAPDGSSVGFGEFQIILNTSLSSDNADVSALRCQSQNLGDIATAAAAAKNGATPSQGTAPQDVSPEQQGQENEEESEENIENDGEDTNSEDDVPSQVVKTRNQSALGNANNVQLNNDWRVRLSLAAGSPPILYNANPAGILAPLAVTNGVIFPYTPDIQIQYSASYEGFNPTHSNYKIYQYQNSSVDTVTINCPFTAQDTNDATYVLAVIHFFRTLTKMFYGQDQTIRPGTPPPLVYLYGLGTFQFNNHPLVISGFNYSLPNDVDYIRVATPSVNANVPVKTDGYNPSPQQLQAIRNLGGTLSPGGQPPAAKFGSPPAGSIQPTYVPTMMSMSITCYPIVSRNDVSNTFSLEQYATGELIQRGFW